MASGGDSRSGESTAEYLTLKKSYTMVIDHVKVQPGVTCNEFFANGFITSQARDWIRTPGIPDYDKASKLIDNLIDKIKNDSDNFNRFMEILKKEGPSADDLVKKLKKSFEEEMTKETEYSREDSSPDTDTPNDRDGLQRLRSEESDSACDQRVNEQSATEEHHSLFPFLDFTKMGENERDALKAKLSRDIDKIKRFYAHTENSILTALEKTVDLGKLQNYVINLVQGQCSPEQIERLRNSDTVYKLSADLYFFKSFFNYDIIKGIVESDNEEKLMGEYETEFKEFCKRSVFEVPPHIFHPSGTHDKCYAFKHSSKLHPPSLGDVLLLKVNLAEILHMESKDLNLKSIKDGCVCLNFLILANVAKNIFPLSERQVRDLSKIQVTFLGCVNQFEIEPLPKMTFSEKDDNQPKTEPLPTELTFFEEDANKPETESLQKMTFTEKNADQPETESLPKMTFTEKDANQPETESLSKMTFSEEDAYRPEIEPLPKMKVQSKVDSKTDGETATLKDEDDPKFSKAKLRELVNELLERPIFEIQQTPLHQKEEKLPRALKAVSPAVKEREFKFETQYWEIEIAKKVALFFKDKSLPQHLKQEIKQKLDQLSSGKWNEEIHRPVKSNNGIILYSADLVEAASIIYQVLVRFSQHLTETPKDHVYTDTIIVWDAVLNHGALNHAAEEIRIAIKNLRSPPTATQLQKTGLLTKPKQYTEKEVCELFSREKFTDIGTKTYSVTTDLISFLDDENERRDYPIKVTEEEHDIIMLPSNKPIVVLGRSGTGKTTVCLNRLWLNFRNNMKRVTTNQQQQCSSTQDGKSISSLSKELPCVESLHQVFITKNYALCVKMKKLFYDFVAGCQHTTHHLPHENDALPEKLSDLQHFPIFVTAKQFFTMLDKSLGNDKERFFKSNVTVESSTNQADTRSLNQLFEIPLSDSDDEDDDNQARTERQNKTCMPMKEIGADEFATEIWPKISKHCKDTKIDPLLIWTEIESFIEGSTKALESEEGFLSKEDYLKIGMKQAPPLERGEVYELFIEYKKCIKHKDLTKQRFSNGMLIANLNRRLPDTHITWSIHEMYIDEVQDFTQAELSVILNCCQDPNRSFLAGDTAQTIMKGTSFRFEDLRSLFYKLKVSDTVPEVHKLTKNYRSHSSITDLASSVIELLKEYFRDDFDLLSPDESNIIGPKPLFICSKTLLDNFLLPQSTSNVSSIEFGADQVVIARDSSEQGKKRMPDYLQDEIVLNVQESKGLEFNDVLLYNFFTDTPKQNQDMWRISAQYLADHPDKVILEEADSDIHPLGYNKRRHRSFCAELKILYTMVTRAKRHIWIYEDSPLEKLPMIKYWQRRNLITLVSRDDSELPKQIQLERSSTEEWKKQGDIYMEKKLWHAARKCYQKAQEAPLEHIAYARALEQRALRTKQTDVAQFRYVAALFLRCSLLAPQKEHVKNAAICLYRAKMYLESSKLFEMIQEYKHAIHICKEYLKSDVDTLVRLYEKSGRYKSAVKLCLRKRKYGSAIEMALEHLPKHDCYDLLKDIVYKRIKVAVEGTHKEDILRFVGILPKTMEQVHFLKLAKMYEEACELLQKGGEYGSAYRICRAQHLYTKGIEIAENAGPRHTNTKHSLILLRAEYHITTKPAPWGDEQNDLKKLLEVKELRGRHKAKACLLLSVIILRSNTDDVQDALKLCSTAYTAYKNARSNAGEIETFCILTQIKERRKEYTLNHTKMIVNTVTVLRQMCALLNKPAAAFTSDVKDAEDFYGLEKYGSDLYYISRQENYFFPLQQDQIRGIDSDGMLQLDTLSSLLQHYKKCEDILIQYLIHFKASWHDKVQQSFTFHSALLKTPFYLQQPYRRYPSEQINGYLRMCETALKIHQMNSAIFRSSNDVIGPINWILSPFSQLNLTFEKENFLLMSQESETIKGLLEERAIKELTRMTRYISDTPNIDNWLEVWRIIYVLGENNVVALTTAIHKQVAAISDKAKIHLGYDPTKHSPSTYVRTDKYSYQSIFAIWERSCKLYRENGDALEATSHSFTYFIQVIASQRCLHQTLSLENLINILSIQCTALFAIISVSQDRKQRPITIVIPESFERMVKSFDLFNCMRQTTYTELLQTCTSQEVAQNPDQLIQDGIKMLISILNLITGRYKKDYCPLQKAASQGTNIEAIHSMVLALTIVGNLIALSAQTTEIQLILNKIMGILQKYSSRGLLSTMYSKLNTIQNTKDLYDGVIRPLLKQADLQLMTMQTVSCLGKEKIRIKPYLSHKVPVSELKWKAPNHDPAHQQLEKVPLNEQGEVSLLETEGPLSATSPVDPYTQETVQNLEISAKPTEHSDEEYTLVDVLEEFSEGDEEPYYVEDIVEDFSTAEVKKDSELDVDEQENEFLNGNQCILCNETADKDHLTSTRHLDQEKLFKDHKNAEMTYNYTQNHLNEKIQECRMEYTEDYELEQKIQEAEQLLKSNNRRITKMYEENISRQNTQELEKMRDSTDKIIAGLDDKRKKILETQKHKTDEVDEGKSEDDDYDDEELAKAKLTSSSKEKTTITHTQD